jgi:uncharacterized protein (DUF1501 family)
MSYLSTRREFVQKGLTLLAAGATVPTFLSQTAWAANDPRDQKRVQQASGVDGKILVVVQLSGGNDGLSTVVPYGDDAYYRQRHTINVPAREVIRLTDYIGLHPNLKTLRPLIERDQMCIIQGVGYPNPNRSHFRSMDIWHSAQPEDETPTSGWVGRYFDATCTGEEPHVGISIGETMPLAMKGQKITPLSFERLDNYRYNGPERERYLRLHKISEEEAAAAIEAQQAQPRRRSRVRDPKPEAPTAQEQLDFLSRTALNAQVSSDQIGRVTRAFRPVGDYPRGEFGDGLRTIAAMIGGGLSTRVYYVSLGGFDTHANQKGRHDRLMEEFGRGIKAFWDDITKQENDERVLVMCFSEFGRRVSQNASGGTDHGAAAPMFLFGSRLKTELVGAHPSLTNLDQGDLRYQIDFRHVYSTILQDWLDTPSKPILGQQFRTIPLLKS